jgi:RNA polymerase sigma factor (sigma-70 family)
MDSEKLDEYRAWQRSLDGDDRAFASLFDAHYTRVLRHIIWVSARTSDAEDLAAAVFLELWRRRDDVRLVDDSVLPWLLVTASNIARNSKRAHRRYARLLSTLPPADESPDIADAIAAEIDAEGRNAELATALRMLSKTDQNLISLTTFEGVSLQVASDALGLSYGAAKTRLSRARRRLNTHLNHLTIHESGTTA